MGVIVYHPILQKYERPAAFNFGIYGYNHLDIRE